MALDGIATWGIVAIFAGGLADRFSGVMGFLWLATVPPHPASGGRHVRNPLRGPLLYGIVFMGHQVGSFTGVWLDGWRYDPSGSSDMVWWLGVAFGLLAAFIHWPIQERPVVRLAPSPKASGYNIDP